MSERRREIKTCELCGVLFTRDIPASAREGDRNCRPCAINPPQEPEDALPPQRSYHVVGLPRNRKF